MARSSSFLEGILVGAAIGFIGGVLLAPRSGKETREKIKNFKRDNEHIIENVKESTEQLIAKTLNAIDTGFDKVGRMVDRKGQKHTNEGDEVYGS
jgi:gas vesicle protein